MRLPVAGRLLARAAAHRHRTSSRSTQTPTGFGCKQPSVKDRWIGEELAMPLTLNHILSPCCPRPCRAQPRPRPHLPTTFRATCADRICTGHAVQPTLRGALATSAQSRAHICPGLHAHLSKTARTSVQPTPGPSPHLSRTTPTSIQDYAHICAGTHRRPRSQCSETRAAI